MIGAGRPREGDSHSRGSDRAGNDRCSGVNAIVLDSADCVGPLGRETVVGTCPCLAKCKSPSLQVECATCSYLSTMNASSDRRKLR